MQKKSKSELIELLKENRPNKFLVIAECIRKKIDLKKIVDSSGYDPWFVREIYELVEYEKILKNKKISKEIYIQAKEYGFSDEKILQISRCSKNSIFNIKKKDRLFTSFRNIDTCSGEFQSKTPYMYSSWNCVEENSRFEDETQSK